MNTKTSLFAALICLFSYSLGAQGLGEFFSKTDAFMEAYVTDGKVAYQRLHNDATALDAVLALAKDIQVDKTHAADYQAFWINAYNLAVIKGIVSNYPIKSPLDKAGFFDKKTYSLAGKEITLNDIENKLLRGNFPTEARFHFVLVCAGLGCPPIVSYAYTPDRLEDQLQQQTVSALNDPNFIRVKGKKVQISQLFEWYKGDFTQNGKSELDFINAYRNEKIDAKAKVGYYAYDWRLNETK
ncbi:MAG: DUF547 domain-containing protein [Flavobacteriaceae bacterium]|nr:DUF547 domain-containing protein [Flavobacteriaceae bacterium]